MRSWTIKLAVVLALLVPALAGAAQNDPRLDRLFARLQEAASATEAQAVDRMIWQVWMESGDAAVDSLMELGVQAMAQGRLPGALGLFDAVVNQKPDFAEGWNKRATVFYMMGAFEKAEADALKTLELEPRHYGALSGIGLIKMRNKKELEAVEAFERALKLNPHLTSVKTNLESLKKRGRDGAI